MSISRRPVIDLDGPWELKWGYRHPTPPTAVSVWLREQRRARNWTQHQLAAEVDTVDRPVTPEDVQAYEQGWELIPNDVLARIVHVLREWPPGLVAQGVASVR